MHDAPLHNPHDAFIKAGLGDPNQMACFLKAYLPQTLTADIDWSDLKLQKTDFLDEQLHRRHADLLFLTRFQDKAVFLYLLFEHQRSPDPWMPLRLLRYQMRIWENVRKADPKARRLPAILPIVFFQNQGKWIPSPHFRELLDLPKDICPDWLDYIPDFKHATINLSDLQLDPIASNLALRVTIKVLRAILEPEAERAFMIGFSALQELEENTEHLTLFRICMTYLTRAGNTLDRKTFYTIIKQSRSLRFRKEAMTIAEQLIQEGRQEGRNEGRMEGERILLERLLVRKFGSLPYEASEKLRHATQVELERWGERILVVNSLDAIFEI